MTQMSYKLFHLSRLSINPVLKASFAVWVLIVLFVFFFPVTSFTEEKKEAGDTLTSPGQVAKSLENQITGNLAELDDLKEQLRQLETLQNSILARIKEYEAQSTVHGQLLLMSKVRVEDLENAIKDNLLASRTLSEEVERFQKDINSKSIPFQKTNDQIELAQKQITDIRQSQLSDAEKRQVDAAIQKLLQVLNEKKQLEDRYLKIDRNLLGQVESALEAKKAIGGKLMAQLKRQKETIIITRLDYQDISGKVLKEELLFLEDRISAVFRLATWKALLEQIKKIGLFRWSIFLGSLAGVST